MPLNRRGVQWGAPLGMPPKDKYIEIGSPKALFKHSKAGGLRAGPHKITKSYDPKRYDSTCRVQPVASG
jgi:hypothetical protein